MSQEERLLILQMVADKKITAAEAAELLRAIGDGKQEAAPAATETPVAGAMPDATAMPPLPELPPVPEVPAAPAAPPAPAAPRAPQAPSASFAAGLSSFIEEVVGRVTSAVSELAEPPYEFPTELTGEFTAAEVPLRIATGNGAVRVQAWEQPGYKALVRVKTRGGNEAEARARAQNAYTVTADANGFTLEAKRFDWHDVAVHVTLLVPRDRRYALQTRTGNGDVELTDVPLVDGHATTGNGRIGVRGGAASRLELRTGNGAVTVEADTVDLEASTGNGTVTVRPTGARGKRLQASTGNGSIHIDTRELPAGTAMRIEAHTAMGGIDVRAPGLEYEREVRNVGNKHVIAHTPGYAQAAERVEIKAHTGMGSVTVE